MTGPPGPIHRFLAEDHARLDALLSRASGAPGEMDLAAFDAFRAGILRHIGMEHQVLLREARRANGGEDLPMARRLRVEHGAIAMLLVPSPSPEIAAEIRSILDGHIEIEEGPGGFFEACDRLLAADAQAVIGRLRGYPQVKLAPYSDSPGVLRKAEDALRLSGRQRSKGG